MIVAYVGDVLFSGSCQKKLQEVASLIEAQVDLRVGESIAKFHGMSKIYDEQHGTLKIASQSMLDATLELFNMTAANTVSTAVNSGTQIEEENDGEPFFEPYAELVGVLLYVSNTVLPDISYGAGKLARFVELSSSRTGWPSNVCSDI